MNELEKKVPKSDFLNAKVNLEAQFMSGFQDPEILHLLQSTVPPVNLRDVSFVQTLVSTTPTNLVATRLQKP